MQLPCSDSALRAQSLPQICSLLGPSLRHMPGLCPGYVQLDETVCASRVHSPFPSPFLPLMLSVPFADISVPTAALQTQPRRGPLLCGGSFPQWDRGQGAPWEAVCWFQCKPSRVMVMCLFLEEARGFIHLLTGSEMPRSAESTGSRRRAWALGGSPEYRGLVPCASPPRWSRVLVQKGLSHSIPRTQTQITGTRSEHQILQIPAIWAERSSGFL